VYDAHALCVGFNLPFDLSRLAISYGLARERFRNGFSFILSKNKFHPRIRIRSLDSTKAFIEFELNQVKYKGRFLDLRTFAFAITNEKMSLETASKHFNSTLRKHSAENHGKVTTDYITYNINDTLTTHALFEKMLERFNELKASIQPEKTYSPASLAKSYLDRMDIKPFLEKNPNFSKHILGYVMTTFYGGRSEVRIRKTPVNVRYMDFASMYPSIFVLMSLWELLTADKIECEDATKDTRELLNKITLESLADKKLWKKIPTIILVIPDHDMLPVRTHFDEENVWNIGLCEVTSNQPLWYALSDIVASNLLTGKCPKILKAVQFKPKGIQAGLRDIEIVGNINVSKNENLIKKLVECRRLKKKERDESKDPSTFERLEIEQDALKTIANSISYGIFIEVNTEDRREDVAVYGLGHFKTKATKKECFGRYFHPIIATMLTSGARLMIAIAEA
jgi:hypothetical protein